MLRHPSLVPLSHQHQHALALCVLIERGLQSADELARKTADLFELEIRNHFDIEERILFPTIRDALGSLPLIDELRADHRRLAALVEGLPQTLAEFGATLSAHIRREERELFEEVQARLPTETLARLGEAIQSEVVRVCLASSVSPQ